jgi:hypothetical protein
VQDKEGNIIHIQYVSNTEAIKYLGCWKAPQGQTQEKQALLNKCTTFARVINCSNLTRKETKYFYEGIYKPSVGYSLPLTYFKLQELDTIQRKAHEAMVTHIGYNRNTAKAVIYGVQKWGGAAFTHLYDVQGYGQISYFLKSWRSPNTHQGKMLRIAVHGKHRSKTTSCRSRMAYEPTSILAGHQWQYPNSTSGSTTNNEGT